MNGPVSKALVLCGGKGTRLRPYTTVIPKPLMPVGDYPILEILLRQLQKAGVEEAVLAVGYMGQLFQAFFGDGARIGLDISYSFEERPLGTAGAVASVIDRLGEDFPVTNGDLLTTLDYGGMLAAHRSSGAAATIGLYRREVKVDFGVVETDEASRLIEYREKPVYRFDVSMGVNCLHRDIVKQYVTEHEYLDMPDLMMRLAKDGHVVRGFRSECFWLDIGRLDDYQQAQEIFDARRGEFLPPLPSER